MNGLTIFWAWFLKYSAFVGSGVASIVVAWFVDKFIARRPKLICYNSQPQLVAVPPQPNPPNQPPIAVETFSLFIYNQGKAPAREVHVGHFASPPAHNVIPDIPRQIVQTPGGGHAIRFPVIPQGVLITISYLIVGNFLTVEQVVAYVGFEEGVAQRVPVIFQRVFPAWVRKLFVLMEILGAWVLLNLTINLIHYLWVTFYK